MINFIANIQALSCPVMFSISRVELYTFCAFVDFSFMNCSIKSILPQMFFSNLGKNNNQCWRKCRSFCKSMPIRTFQCKATVWCYLKFYSQCPSFVMSYNVQYFSSGALYMLRFPRFQFYELFNKIIFCRKHIFQSGKE